MGNLAIQYSRRKARSQPAAARRQAPDLERLSPKRLYFGLLRDEPSEADVSDAAMFLEHRLAEGRQHDVDIPGDPHDLPAWSDRCTAKVRAPYARYLENRKSGAPRAYFSNKAHALYFLKGVAPTKMVDGAWLYGLLSQWKDSRFLALLQTYLEELGGGDPGQNHVLLYKKLLSNHGCDQWSRLSDRHFVQGAIQLALAPRRPYGKY